MQLYSMSAELHALGQLSDQARTTHFFEQETTSILLGTALSQEMYLRGNLAVFYDNYAKIRQYTLNL